MAEKKSTKKTVAGIMGTAQEYADAARRRLAEKAAKAEEKPQQLFLPGVKHGMRAMPNHLARSSLFAPVAPGRKKMHKDHELVTRGGTVVRFWGEQLDEAQADVWLQAMYEAMRVPLGQPVVIKRSVFLAAIGRADSGQNYQWLHRSMKALAFAMLVIEVETRGQPVLSIGKTNALHMIDSFDYDDENEAYTLRINPRWCLMHDAGEYARIDWEKRLQFGRHQNMAKALQRLIATSDTRLQRFGLDWLKKKLEYTGRQRDFESALLSALRELERLAIICGGKIGKSSKDLAQVSWIRL